jgi:BirA family biotin operon repressor/biotin-[acetyl-CoA-carboxylase] ligase
VVISRPPIDREALQATVERQWARVDVVDSTESTNADLLADARAPDRSVLVAEVQSAGRGRLDRSWSSPARAGLTFSVLLRPELPAPAASSLGWLPLLAGVAVHDALRPLLPVTLKWPNDVLDADGGKLAGILAQASGSAVVIGVGLNVWTQRDELPVPTASSLALRGVQIDRTELLGSILLHLAERYDAWLAAGGDAAVSGIATAYRIACGTLGAAVDVDTPAGHIAGLAVDVDPGGRLVLDTSGGRRTVAAGDVTHVRPPSGPKPAGNR